MVWSTPRGGPRGGQGEQWLGLDKVLLILGKCISTSLQITEQELGNCLSLTLSWLNLLITGTMYHRAILASRRAGLATPNSCRCKSSISFGMKETTLFSVPNPEQSTKRLNF